MEKLRSVLLGAEMPKGEDASIPARPPVLCPGCPHRGVFYVLNKLGMRVMGDIGCYTLGNAQPLDAVDTCLCMGAGITMAQALPWPSRARSKWLSWATPRSSPAL